MTLSGTDMAAIDAAIIHMIAEDIGKELTEYYGAAVFYGGNVKPEQPNNELRNALNHMARAREGADMAEANEDLRKAENHIERAKRDSLKLATIGLFEEIRGLLANAAYHHGGVPPAISIRRSQLNAERRNIYAKESAGYKGTTVRMLRLFVEANGFLGDLQEQFPAASTGHKWRLFFYRIQANLLGYGIAFALGVAGSLTAAYLWDHWPTSKTAVSKATGGG